MQSDKTNPICRELFIKSMYEEGKHLTKPTPIMYSLHNLQIQHSYF